MYAPGNMIRGMQTLALLGTTLAMTGVAGADIITARFDAVSLGTGVIYSVDSGLSYHQTLAGSLKWTRLGGDYAGPGADAAFTTYCIEIAQYVSYGRAYDYTVRAADLSPVPGSGMGEDRANLLAELFGRYYMPEFTSSTDAAAFQVAVWEVTHDDGRSLSDGIFRIRDGGSVAATAQGWLDSLDGSGPRRELLAMTNAGAQDQIFVVPSASSAGLLFAAGLFGCPNRRRRKIQFSRA